MSSNVSVPSLQPFPSEMNNCCLTCVQTEHQFRELLMGEEEEEENFTFADSSSVGSTTAASSDGSVHEHVASYEKATPLFQGIEKKDWESVLLFLKTGRWSKSIWFPSNDHMSQPTPHIQCRTWVFERSPLPVQSVAWSQLPLHAAVTNGAPAVVLQTLLEIYPDSVRCRDSSNMLPLHLAFGFGATDSSLLLLLKAWPEAARQFGGPDRNRLPHQFCEAEGVRDRGLILHTLTAQIKCLVDDKHVNKWKRIAERESKRMGVDVAVPDTLSEFIVKLLEDRKQLLKVKRSLKGQCGSGGSANGINNTKSIQKVIDDEQPSILNIFRGRKTRPSASPALGSESVFSTTLSGHVSVVPISKIVTEKEKAGRKALTSKFAPPPLTDTQAII